MWCTKCNQHLSKCICPDLMERLLSVSGSVFAFEMCSKCKKHHSQCKCAEPERVIVGGREPAKV